MLQRNYFLKGTNSFSGGDFYLLSDPDKINDAYVKLKGN